MIKNKLSVGKWPLKKKLSRRVGLSSCFQHSDRFAISDYSPPMKWIMHDLSRNKMAGINSRLTGASPSEILGIQEDAVPGKRRLCNWPESFERTGRTCWATDVQLLSSFKDMSMAISGFMNVCKPYSKSLFIQHWQKWKPQRSLVEASSAIQRSTLMSLCKLKKPFGFPQFFFQHTIE